MNKQNAFQILHLDSNASIEEIKSAYRRRAKQFHPDKFCHVSSLKEKAEAKMKEINLAFQTLCNFSESDNSTAKSGRSGRGFKQNKKQQGLWGNLRMILSAFILFPGFCKKKYREKAVKRENNRAKLKKHKRSMGKNHYSCSDTCINSEKKIKLRSFECMLKKHLETEITFTAVRNQGINRRINFFNSHPGGVHRRTRVKHFMDTGSGPVQRISPISPVQKIT